MKQFFSVVLALVLVTPVFSQHALRQLLSADHGVSKQLVVLPDSQKVAFNPAKAQSAFGLDAASDLVLTQTETDKLGTTHYRYAQTYKGIPVENAMFIAHARSGLLTAAGGNIITDFSLQLQTGQTGIQAGFTQQQAIEAALQYVHAEQYAWQDADYEQGLKTLQGSNATYYPVAAKVWYSGEEQVDPSRLKLAYRVDVYSLKPFDRKFIYIDAQNGKVLGEKARMLPSDAAGTVNTVYSGAQPVHIDYSGTQYRLRDYTKGKGIITLNAAAKDSDYTSASANWSSLSGMDRYGLDAHYGVSATWTFYYNNFNRNSVDNNGYQLVSHVNDPAVAAGNNGNPANAYWDGYSMHYGYLTNGSGLTAIDITGHELTHGVTQYSSQLSYSGESGAINESMSDIMGKSVQFYSKPGDVNWQISNDVPWFIRDMSNPNARSQPDTYGGSYWVTTTGCNATSRNDYCGVHTNSGVGNYMFYLLVTGGSGKNDIGNNFAVAGIGLSKADQILYRTNTVYLGPTAKYADWRAACIQAATDLYGASSAEAAQVMNAWYAVGVGAAAATCNPPTGLTANNITGTQASLAWTAAAGVQSYTLQWKVVGAAAWTTVTGITTAAYTLTALTPGTAYTFQVATVCSSGTSGYSTPANFTTTASSANGLTYKYYEGTWNSLPNFSTLTPAATGSSANTDIGTRPAGRNDNFAFVWEGYIVITTPGTYTFETVSDDGSKLYFNSLYNAAATPTVNNDGLHAPVSATGTVDILAAGTYPISITFFEKDGGEQMQVYWTGPNFARQPIPNAAFTQTPPASVNGLSYKYYEGTWTSLPDFNTLTPVKTGTSTNTDISVRTPGHDDNFGFVWQGYINITTPGTYTFETVSDDGSRLYFNQLYDASAYPTVNNDGVHAPVSATGTVYIGVAGVYPISVTFFEKDGGEQMQVYWTGPNFARQLIPNAAFTQAPPAAATPLTYKYYEGTWNSLPDFNMLTPVKTGTSANTDISIRTPGRNDYFGFVWQGYINLLRPGSYTFETVSDDGSKLYFNLPYDSAAAATVSNDGLHAPVSATGTVNAAVAGVYPVAITFFEKDGGEQMQVYWTGPNFARQLIPNQAFSVYRPASAQAGAPVDTAFGIVSNSLTGNLNTMKVQVGKIYPNPFTEIVRIDFYNSAAANSIGAGIYDVNGRLVYQQPAHTFAPGNNTLQMDVSGKRLSNGLYFIKLAVNGATIKTVKLVKAK